MSKPPRQEWVRKQDLKFHPELTPRLDPTFDTLLGLALAGDLGVYFAAVPRDLIQPFDEDYNVTAHPVGRAAVDQEFERGAKGQPSTVWVYETDRGFILSDDYVALAAAQRGQPDYMPCWVLGRPRHAAVKDAQGPIDDVRKALGWA